MHFCGFRDKDYAGFFLCAGKSLLRQATLRRTDMLPVATDSLLNRRFW